MGDVLSFDSFVPGTSMGSSRELVDAAMVEQWKTLYPHDAPPDAQSAPLGLATALMMHGYMQILSPRPPGNIHAGQRMTISAPVRVNEAVTMEMICKGKQMRGERRFVEFDVVATGEGRRPLFGGVINIIWAL